MPLRFATSFINLSRVCGDDPIYRNIIDYDGSICPAYAGMILSASFPCIVHWHLSRVCGDDPAGRLSPALGYRFVPRMRG